MKHPIIRPEAFFKIPKICEKELWFLLDVYKYQEDSY
jgi:hypothetical protein